MSSLSTQVLLDVGLGTSPESSPLLNLSTKKKKNKKKTVFKLLDA